MLFISWVGVFWLRSFVENQTRTLRVSWTQDVGIKLGSASDGPFVVTHLFRVAGSEPEKLVARLTSPIVIVDSAGATLSKSEFDKLKWYGYLGDSHPSLTAGTPIVTFYYRPLVTKPSIPQ